MRVKKENEMRYEDFAKMSTFRWWLGFIKLVVADEKYDILQKKSSQSEHFSPIYSQIRASKMYPFSV